MSQHDQVIADAAGAAARADINAAFAALFGNSSGTSEPGTTIAYQWWADTTSGWLKQRNAANSAWIKRLPLGTGARVDVASAATIDLDAAAVTSDYIRITGTTNITAVTLAEGQRRIALANAATPITHGASLVLPGAASYTCAAGDLLIFVGEAAGVVRVGILKGDGTAVVAATARPPVRQTVLSGPVDSAGLSAFVGATGSTTVTATGTLKATAAAGGDADYTGSITNPSWTGLSTNGTMYLFLDITSAGVVTTGSTALAPVYQWGGTYSVTNFQNTFNIQEMTMKVGNGAAASQVYRVFVGEVTVAGGVVSDITWYALMGRYLSADTAFPADGTAFAGNHNIGVSLMLTPPQCFFVCQSADSGYAAGDVIVAGAYAGALSYNSQLTISLTAKVVSCDLGGNINIQHKSTGANTYPTKANFKYRFAVQRGW